MRINYTSLGCKVNLYETVAICNMFVKAGFKLVTIDEESDVTIINTCTVTQTSDAKSRKTIRHIIKNNPNSIICVMGCYAQLNIEELKSIYGVDIVTGTSNRSKIFNEVMKKLENKSTNIIDLSEDISMFKGYENIHVDSFDSKTRGFVKIQDGCENFCSYCTIPYSRGKLRSRNKEEVIKEISHLVKSNMKEIVLTGINTGAYGIDLDNYSFKDLLQDIITSVEGNFRLRISSIEITEITDELIELIHNNKDYFCNHLHIPLQGGCDEVLTKMNRKYNTNYYEERINYIRKKLEDVNITCDILTGFNGETNEYFERSFEFINKLSFGETHIFPYSPRKKTKAYEDSKKLNFTDVINGSIIKERVNRLIELNKINALNYRKRFENKTLDIIVEKNVKGTCYGHSSNYISVKFKSNAKENDLVKVMLKEAGYPVSIAVEVKNV